MTELLVILVVGLLVLGPKRLPELARSLGRGLAEFRRASTDMRREFLDVAEEVKRDPADLGLPGVDDPAVAPPLPKPSASTESPDSDERDETEVKKAEDETATPKVETQGG